MIGLAVLGTAAWSAVANSIHTQTAHAATAAGGSGGTHPSQTAIYNHALATGFPRALLVAAGIMLLAMVITNIAIRVRRADLGEVRP